MRENFWPDEKLLAGAVKAYRQRRFRQALKTLVAAAPRHEIHYTQLRTTLMYHTQVVNNFLTEQAGSAAWADLNLENFPGAWQGIFAPLDLSGALNHVHAKDVRDSLIMVKRCYRLITTGHELVVYTPMGRNLYRAPQAACAALLAEYDVPTNFSARPEVRGQWELAF